jgi:phenylalanine N-monooxygenase
VEHVESLWSLLTHIYAIAMLDCIPCLKVLDLDGHEKMVSKAMSRAGRQGIMLVSVEKILFCQNVDKVRNFTDLFCQIFFLTPKVCR